MKKGILLLLFLGVIGWLFAASASWNYDTQTGNIGTTYSWIDASGGTDLGLGDDSAANVQWPFDFQIYDDNYTGGTDNISVCSNGYMRFDGAASTSYGDAQNYDLTSSATSLGQIICVGIYDDNMGDSNSHAYWTVTGTSPNRILTIEYQDLEINYNSGLYADIEVQFYEADKKIVILFGDDNVTQTSADQGIHSGVAGYFYKWGDVDSNTNQTWLELTIPSNTGPGAPTNPNPADGTVNVAIDNNPDISWDNPTGASYNYVYFGTDQTLVDNMDSSVQVLGDGSTLYTSYNQTADLSYNTNYYWKVVEYDGSGNSTEGIVYSFKTVCANVTSYPWTEDFSTWPPDCWDLTGGTASWDQYSSGSVQCARANYWGQQDGTTDIMTTPTFDVSSLTAPLLTFDWSHKYDSSYPGDSLSVEVSDDNGATWTQVWAKGGSDLDSGDGANNTSPGSFVSSGNIDLSSFGTTLLIRFYGTSGWGPALFVDNVVVKETPSCPDPSGQTESNITKNSADLDWTENGTATAWQIEYGPTGYTQGSGTTVNASSHPYTLTGLSANTAYDWYVRADCGGGSYSDWIGPHTFTTLCDAQSTFPYAYSFEDQTTGDNSSCPTDGSIALTSCWKNVSGEGSDWKPLSGSTASSGTGPSSAQDGSIYMYCETSGSCGPEFDLYAPEFDFSSLTTPYITFYYHMYGNAVGKLSLTGSTDNGTTWDTLWTKNGDQGDAWYQAQVSTSYGGQSSVLIRWHYADPTSYTGDVAIDNVTISEAPSCPDPSDQTESNITNNSADLDWTENGTATTWEIEYGPTGFAQGSGTTVNASSHPYTLTGLSANTTYDWYVRSDCGGSYSNWVGPSTFTTLCNTITSFPYIESFETGVPPSCWSETIVNGSTGDWTRVSTSQEPGGINPYDGTYMAQFNSYNAQTGNDTRLETGDLDFTGFNAVYTSFYMYHDTGYSNANDRIQVQVYSGGTWNNVGDAISRYDGTTGWKKHYVDLTAYAGQTVKVGYLAISGYGNDIYLDKVTISEAVVNDNNDVLFSEVCDNMSGQAENTGFIELFNRRLYSVDLSGDMINMGAPGVYGDYTFTFPAGTTIAPLGYIVIANGASLADFNTAWSKSLTSDQFFTDSGLALTSGKAYEYDNGSKAQTDTTPAVNANSREVRKQDKTWDGSTTPSNGTPGETSGGDEPLGSVLVSFMANFQAHELTLTWAVSSQNNISQWNIYRSSEDNFVTASKIGSINVQGEDVGMHEYSFTDNSGFNYVNNQTYYFWIESVDLSGTSELLGNTSITINDNENHDAPVVVRYGLRNYPNPFNPSTKIEFAVKESGKATLYIYNVKGQLVKKADQGYINADKVYSYIWNGTDMNNKHVANGLYLYKLVTPKKTYTKKMIMLK